MKPWRAEVTTVLAERAAATGIDRKGRVLDVGCGKGELGAALAEAGFRAIDGIETNEAWIEAAGMTQAYLRLIRASLAQGVPLSADVHDLALCRAFAPVPGDAAAALKEMTRLVRPEGRALFVVERDRFEAAPFKAAIERLDALGQASLRGIEDLSAIDPALRLLDFHVHW